MRVLICLHLLDVDEIYPSISVVSTETISTSPATEASITIEPKHSEFVEVLCRIFADIIFAEKTLTDNKSYGQRQF